MLRTTDLMDAVPEMRQSAVDYDERGEGCERKNVGDYFRRIGPSDGGVELSVPACWGKTVRQRAPR